MDVYIILQTKNFCGDMCGLKEDLAMYCEKYGDIAFVDVREQIPEQLKIKE